MVMCLIGGIAVLLVSPSRYSGSARVILDYIRPDPTTGTVVPSKMLDAYLTSQVRLLRDNQVAIPAVEALGWLDSPDVQAAYAARPASDHREFDAWVASQVISGTYAHMVEDSNIMEITYNAESRELAVAVAEALRSAYIQSSIQSQRDGALASSETTAARIERVKSQIAALEATQRAFERQNNMLVGQDGRDAETARLRQMAKRVTPPLLLRSGAEGPAAAQLRVLDEVIAARGSSLGPNNPTYIAMLRQRALLAAQVQAGVSTAASRASALDAANRASTADLELQKSKVLSAREPILRLRLMQDELDQRHAELDELTASMGRLRELSGIANSSISPIGVAKPSPEPVFPNKGLILPATSGLGLVLGVLLALFVELLGRRIRAPRDLEMATGAPVLAEVPHVRKKRSSRRRGRPSRAGTIGDLELSAR